MAGNCTRARPGRAPPSARPQPLSSRPRHGVPRRQRPCLVDRQPPPRLPAGCLAPSLRPAGADRSRAIRRRCPRSTYWVISGGLLARWEGRWRSVADNIPALPHHRRHLPPGQRRVHHTAGGRSGLLFGMIDLTVVKTPFLPSLISAHGWNFGLWATPASGVWLSRVPLFQVRKPLS